MGCEFLAVCHHPVKFGDHGHCKSEDMFLIYHVNSPDHMFKELYVTLWVGAFHSKHHLPRLVAIGRGY